jgi:hypothetical protein
MNEVNVDTIDLGDELRERVQSRLAFAPVVLRPVPRKLLNRGELDALGRIVDDFAVGPLCRLDAAAEVTELPVRDVHSKRPNLGTARARLPGAFSDGSRHGFDSPEKAVNTQRTRGNGCRRGADKTAAIEVGRFGHASVSGLGALRLI